MKKDNRQLQYKAHREEEQQKIREKVDNLKVGDIISIYITMASSARHDCSYYEKELYRLIISKKGNPVVETIVLYSDKGTSENPGDKYTISCSGLRTSSWRMA